MKKIFFLTTIFALFLAGCATQNQQANQNGQNQNSKAVKDVVVTDKGAFSVELKTNPLEVKAGEKADLSFTVRNAEEDIVKDLQIVHEKPMHLLIVSEDLDEFYHEHPELQSDGSYKASFTFPNGGNYRLYTDITPPNATQLAHNFALTVAGNKRAAKEIKADETFEKTVEGIKVLMKPEADLVSEKEMLIDFTVYDAQTGALAEGMQKYLGEAAHFVVISQDLKEFVHAHPMSLDNVKHGEHSHNGNVSEKPANKMMNAPENAQTSAHINFPKAGIYRIWAQFQRSGKVITVPFTVDVKQGAEEKSVDISKAKFPEGALKVIVSKDGFMPQEISFRQGQPLKLAFYRADAENCADEVVFKDLNIRKSLPVGKVVLIDIPTNKAGEFAFACGMGMYEGKIVVQ